SGCAGLGAGDDLRWVPLEEQGRTAARGLDNAHIARFVRRELQWAAAELVEIADGRLGGGLRKLAPRAAIAQVMSVHLMVVEGDFQDRCVHLATDAVPSLLAVIDVGRCVGVYGAGTPARKL